jgi:hypothetical protein
MGRKLSFSAGTTACGGQHPVISKRDGFSVVTLKVPRKILFEQTSTATSSFSWPFYLQQANTLH